MQYIRVIRIPELKVVTSGAITTMEELDAFDQWWSAIHTEQYITPRDFMWFNEEKGYMEWVFAVPENYSDYGKYQLIDFPGGLYAVAASKDTEEDCNQAREEICRWIAESSCFELASSENDASKRYTMNHITTPKIFKEKLGYHLCDNFVPIVAK